MQASEELKINYSSAKAIIADHRKATLPHKIKTKSKVKGKLVSFRIVGQN